SWSSRTLPLPSRKSSIVVGLLQASHSASSIASSSATSPACSVSGPGRPLAPCDLFSTLTLGRPGRAPGGPDASTSMRPSTTSTALLGHESIGAEQQRERVLVDHGDTATSRGLAGVRLTDTTFPVPPA